MKYMTKKDLLKKIDKLQEDLSAAIKCAEHFEKQYNALKDKGMVWCPIEQAPRNRPILTCRLIPGIYGHETDELSLPVTAQWDKERQGWIHRGGWDIDRCNGFYMQTFPTHFMLLDNAMMEECGE